MEYIIVAIFSTNKQPDGDTTDRMTILLEFSQHDHISASKINLPLFSHYSVIFFQILMYTHLIYEDMFDRTIVNDNSISKTYV